MSTVKYSTVQNHRSTLSTGQVSMVEFDVTNIPGLGGVALVLPYVIRAKTVLFMTAATTPDHSSRVWEQSIVWERTNANGGVLRVLGGPFADDGGGGLFGASSAGNPSYDVSGNLCRMLMIPYSANALTWFGRMDLTILQG